MIDLPLLPTPGGTRFGFAILPILEISLTIQENAECQEKRRERNLELVPPVHQIR